MASGPRHRIRELVAIYDAPRFRATMRAAAAVGFAIAVFTEVMAYVAPDDFPRDTLGFALMATAFAACGLAAHRGLSRRTLGVMGVVLFGVLGWYLARAVALSGGQASPHREGIYAVLIGANALLTFSAIEFAGVALVMTASFTATSVWMGVAVWHDYRLTFLYLSAVVVLAIVGIVGRNRLQRSELAAHRELEELNESLEERVKEQVERIGRAQLLGRYLPREISERVMEGAEAPRLGHARREVTVLCALPVGFLEAISAMEAEKVAPLVNGFVSAMSRLAHDHGGIIERFVGPRITVLFGAVEPVEPGVSAADAVAMARAMQHESNRLLAQWEREGFATLKLRMAIGVAAGPCVVGTFGSERRVEYSALGEAMVRAHRLASVAIPGEVRLDAVAAARAGNTSGLQPASPVEMTPGHPAPTFVLAAEHVSGEMGGVAHGALSSDAAISAAFEPTALGSTLGPEVTAREQAAAPPSLPPGTLLDGRYRIEEQIGRGGMAAVYRARHVNLDQLRAIKLISGDRFGSAHAVAQFRQEAEATARIHHPNVVRLHDFGRSIEGYYYLALDFVAGRPLSDILRVEGPLGPERAVRLGLEILAALQAAHELRLVHRDVKPSNVIIDRGGRARVTDFGLAQPVGFTTEPGMPPIAGTPAYMSPEQCQGRAIDGRSDLWSFGVTCYEMLAGERPFAGAGYKLFRAIAEAEPAPLSARNVDRELWQLIRRCLHKDPSRRPDSAASLAAALQMWLSENGATIPAESAV